MHCNAGFLCSYLELQRIGEKGSWFLARLFYASLYLTFDLTFGAPWKQEDDRYGFEILKIGKIGHHIVPL